ncbi:CCR4-NOT transcription complex subunit 6-like-B [Rhypophila decipiens]|uniref:CCR4-NOT transcription complex subunit 6-like-B n=1 Tax=Rhypophila decipiens TaxID=261697 RepID=A0AAN7BCR0_9PEZI|nr:CCR4-NOT transcription complex subunit 6-like-B [Rhypophila decipiens]
MAEEPSLPTLPPPLPRTEGRKRGRGADGPPSGLSSNSSDPAIFSSDDDPALDNYVHGRRKKRYVGTWYDQHPVSSDSADSALGEDMGPRLPKLPKRKFRRQADSGVYLGLEGSTDTDDGFELEPCAAKLPLPPRNPQPVVRKTISPEEEKLRGIVQHCVEEGTEAVDLADLGVESISDESLEPLQSLTLIPTVTEDVAFEHKDPRIMVFLSNNRLTKFPLGLINIENLTVLSLRANRLQVLPPCIASLKNLRTLNVAQNFLRYLPSELLELMKKGSNLQDLQLHPNPYYQPKERSYCEWGTAEYEQETFGSALESEIEGDWEGITTKLRSRTPVQYLDTAQNLRSSFSFSAAQSNTPSPPKELDQEDFWELAVPRESGNIDRQDRQTPVRSRRGPPSLLESAIRAAMSVSELEELPELYNDRIPHHLSRVMDKAIDITKEGGQRCSVCRRETWSPLTEWIEFRELRRTHVKRSLGGGRIESTIHITGNDDEVWVPFVRKGCSWRCIPHKSPSPSREQRERLLMIP